MHSLVETELEEYLSGSGSRELHRHLAECADCLREAEQMRDVSLMLGQLRDSGAVEPPLGFSQRLQRSLREQRARGGFWSLFKTDGPFVTRVAFASLLSLAILGGFLASQDDTIASSDHTPEAVMASHDISRSATTEQHQNHMLVTLANYQVR